MAKWSVVNYLRAISIIDTHLTHLLASLKHACVPTCLNSHQQAYYAPLSFLVLCRYPSKRWSFVFIFRKRLQNVLIKTSIFALLICLQKTSSRSLQDVFQTSCQDVFKTFSRRLAKTFQDIFKMSCQDVSKTSSNVFETSCKIVLKTFTRRLAKMSSRRFQDVSSG